MKSIYIKLIVVMILWSFTPVVGVILSKTVSPYHSSFMRFFTALIAVLVIAIYQRKKIQFDFKIHLRLFLMGLTGAGLYNIFYFRGLELSTAMNAILLFNTVPIVTLLLSVLFSNEHFHWVYVVGAVVSIFGVTYTITKGDFSNLNALNVGDIFLMGCNISWIAYSFIARHISKTVLAFDQVFFTTIYGVVCLFLLELYQLGWSGFRSEFLKTTWSELAGFSYFGIMGTVLAFTWYSQGIKEIGIFKTSSFYNLTPIFGAVLSSFVIGEVIDQTVVIGAVCVILGLNIVNSLQWIEIIKEKRQGNLK